VIEEKYARATIDAADRIILAVQATGGYACRKRIPLSGEELERFVDRAVPTLRGMVMRLMAAEYTLERWGKTAHYHLAVEDLARTLGATPPPMPEPAVQPAHVQRRAAVRRGEAA